MPSFRSPFLQCFPVNSAKIPLRWLLVVPFVLQTVGAVALVGYLSYRSGQQAVEKLAHQLMKNVGLQVNQELDRYLQTAHDFNQYQIAAIESGAINLENLDRLHLYLILQHQQTEDLTTLMLGTPQGNFRVSHRVSKRDFGVATNLKPEELPFEASFSNPSNPAILNLYSIDEAGKLQRYLETIKNIDVRDRPWYRQAVKTGKAGWTSPFQIGRTNILALNAYNPFYNKSRQLLGVFAVNISLNQLSDFLGSLEVGQSGEVFIIDRNGLLIANSTAEASYSVLGNLKNGISQPGTMKFKRRLPAEIPNSAIQDSYQYLKANFSNLATVKSPPAWNFQIRGKRYFLTVSPYQDQYGLDWLVVTVIPESDFMAQIHTNNRITILLCLLTLSMAIASGLIIANRFTTRITRLNRVSQQLATGNLTQRLPNDSSILEVQGLAQSFNLMADQLEESFDQIKIALEESKEKFTTVFRTSPDPIAILTTAEGCFVEVNTRMSEYYGYSREELIGHTATKLGFWVNLLDRQQFRQLLEQGAVYNFETKTRIKSGETRVLLLSGERCNLEGQDVTILVIKDISDRKQAEEALRLSEERWQLAIEGANDGIWDHNLITNENFLSPRCLEMLGCSFEQVNTFEKLTEQIHPEDRPVVQNILEKYLNRQIPLYVAEYRIRYQDGSYKWISSRGKAVWNKQGIPVRMIGSVTDITDRHQLDTMKNEFVSMVSHELRTPLTSIQGSLSLLESGVLKNKPDRSQQMLQIALQNTERLVRLVNDILNLQRLDSGTVPLVKEICQINDLIEQAVESVRAIADLAQLSLEWTPLDASVSASGDEIIQTLINLLGNAIKFSPPGSTIWLKVEVINNLDLRITEKFPDLTEINPEKYILFSITDQGRGIPPDKLESIFGRFQQVTSSDSREKGGTGLGLAICKNIVQRHQGLIWVESVMGQGSTFYFTLPLKD